MSADEAVDYCARHADEPGVMVRAAGGVPKVSGECDEWQPFESG